MCIVMIIPVKLGKINMTGFEKRYTEDQVIEAIEQHSNVISSRQIADKLGCSKLTVDNLLKDLLASGEVDRVNLGTDNKKFWAYSRKVWR